MYQDDPEPMEIVERRRVNVVKDNNAVALEEAYQSAVKVLSSFIAAIELTLIEYIRSILEEKIVLEFYNDGSTKPYVYKNGKQVENVKFQNFALNGYYIIKNFSQQIELKLKQKFPTLIFKIEKKDISWIIVLENFIDAKSIVRIWNNTNN